MTMGGKLDKNLQHNMTEEKSMLFSKGNESRRMKVVVILYSLCDITQKHAVLLHVPCHQKCCRYKGLRTCKQNLCWKTQY